MNLTQNITYTQANWNSSTYMNRYHYGMLQPKRNFMPEKYRFGAAGGAESIDEIHMLSKSIYDLGVRWYDSRVGPGGMWSCDPLEANYPYLTPYQYGNNNPIWYREIGGQDHKIYINVEQKTITIQATFYTDTREAAKRTRKAVHAINRISAELETKDRNGNPMVYKVQFALQQVDAKGAGFNSAEEAGTADLEGNFLEVAKNKDRRLLESTGKTPEEFAFGKVLEPAEDSYSLEPKDAGHFQQIVVARRSKTRTTIHEILHILGSGHGAAANEQSIMISGGRGTALSRHIFGSILIKSNTINSSLNNNHNLLELLNFNDKEITHFGLQIDRNITIESSQGDVILKGTIKQTSLEPKDLIQK